MNCLLCEINISIFSTLFTLVIDGSIQVLYIILFEWLRLMLIVFWEMKPSPFINKINNLNDKLFNLIIWLYKSSCNLIVTFVSVKVRYFVRNNYEY